MDRTLLHVACLVSLSHVHAQSTLVLQPDASDGIDASLGYHDNFGTSNNNYGTDLYLKAYARPGATGGVNANRGLLKFDLAQLPAGAVIQSAQLELFATGQINSVLPGHYGDNACWLRRAAAAWSESIVTWDTQPSGLAQDEILLPQSTSLIQDYAIDVTAMVSLMASSSSLNTGWLLALDVEDPSDSAAVLFYSSDWSVASKRPKLTIMYSPVGIPDLVDASTPMAVWLDHAGDLAVRLPEQITGAVSLALVDGSGRLVHAKTVRTGTTDRFSIAIPVTARGMYIVRIGSAERQWSSPLLIGD